MPMKGFWIFNFVQLFLTLLEIPENFLLLSNLKNQLYIATHFCCHSPISLERPETEAVVPSVRNILEESQEFLGILSRTIIDYKQMLRLELFFFLQSLF